MTRARILIPSKMIVVLSFPMALLLGAFVAISTTNQLPFLGDKSLVFALMIVPVMGMVTLLLVRGDVGFGVLVVAATVLIPNTGMQLQLDSKLTTSALEILILGGVLVLITRPAVTRAPPQWPRLVTDRPLLLFAILSTPSLFIALQSGVSPQNIISELKGYFLYPFLAYLIVAWVTTEHRWKLIILLGIAGGLWVGLTGIQNWVEGRVVAGDLVGVYTERIAGSFGVINQYGFYLSGMSLVTLGVALNSQRSVQKIIFLVITGIFVFAMSLSGSRGAWTGLLAGFVVLSILLPKRFLYWVPILLIGVAIFLWQSPSLSGRIALQASSDSDRLYFLLTGWEIFQRYPILGAGWGAAFWLTSSGFLMPIDLLPWLHNDYLNLLTQVGILGTLPFLWLWWRLLKSVWLWFRAHTQQLELIAGLTGALVAILIEAGTDHVFWRPDIAGQVWWLAGLLIAGILLEQKKKISEAPRSS